MHELGIMYHVVQTVQGFMQRNGLSQIDTIVLQIGKQSPVVPKYIEACYAPAIDGTNLSKTKLKLELTEGTEFLIKEIIAC